MSNLNLKYDYLVEEIVNTLLQDSFISRLKDFFVNVWNKIKAVIVRQLDKIRQAEFGEEGEFTITFDIPETLTELAMTKTKIASASKLKGCIFEVETILEVQSQVRGMKTNVSPKISQKLQDQLRASVGNKAGKIIKECQRGARVASKLILNPITAEGGTVKQMDVDNVAALYTGGLAKQDIIVKWKKIGLSRQQIEKLSLKLYAGKMVTLANKSIDTFFNDFFSPKQKKEINNLIDKDKQILKMKDQETAMNKKVKQLTRKFKKSQRAVELNEERRELRAKIHPRIMSIVFKYIKLLLSKPNTRNLFIQNFFDYTGLSNDPHARMIFVLTKKKGRFEGMVEEPDIDLSKLKLAYGGGSTFQIKNGRTGKTMANFGMKIGGHKLDVSVPFTSGKFRRF